MDRIVTGDEKWIVYFNIKNKRQWLDPGQTPIPTPKNKTHAKKILLCVWWDIKGIIHFELLEENQTINSGLYIEQLTRLEEALNQKRPALVNRKGLILHHDNARPHVAKNVIQKINSFNWEILPHPPYSPDIAPSDYHLFRSLQHHLIGKKFNQKNDIKNDLQQFFDNKPVRFYRKGIENPSERWQKIIW